MAQDTPSRKFDSHGFIRPSRAAVVARAADPAPVQLTASERLMVADGLTELGYSARQINLILRGPSEASIEQVRGRIIPARVLPEPTPSGNPLDAIDNIDGTEERNYTRGYVEGAFSRQAVAEFPIAGKPDPAYQAQYNKGYSDGKNASPPEYENRWTQEALEQAQPSQSEGDSASDDAENSTTSEANSPPPAPSDSSPAEAYPTHAATDTLGMDQGDIVDAVWHNLHGDPGKLAILINNFTALTGPLQAYLVAAVESGKQDYIELNRWMADFNRQQATLAKQRASDTAATQKGVSSVGGVVAAAANAIPVVGQALSAIIAVGTAISVALLGAFPLPARNAADQVHDGVEGLSNFAGLSLDWPQDNPPLLQDRLLATKQAVVNDPVALMLPLPRKGTRYPFTPTLASFQNAAHKLGLYAGEPNTLFPPTPVSAPTPGGAS